MQKQVLISRISGFVQDFLLENPRQLVFPLGSFLLLLGGSRSWLPPNQTLLNPNWQAGQTGLWFDVSSPWALLGYYLSLLSVRIAFLASIVLWSLPLENLVRRFVRGVVAPAVLGLIIFSTMVLSAKRVQVSVLESESGMIIEVLRLFAHRLGSLGFGFYLTLIGIATVAGAL